MELTDREIIGLFLFLRNTEEKVDSDMQKLTHKLERLLFEKLSIHQLENLEQLYREGLDGFPN